MMEKCAFLVRAGERAGEWFAQLLRCNGLDIEVHLGLRSGVGGRFPECRCRLRADAFSGTTRNFRIAPCNVRTMYIPCGRVRARALRIHSRAICAAIFLFWRLENFAAEFAIGFAQRIAPG